MIFEKYVGNETNVVITDPAGEEGYLAVGDKAFLSNKTIEKLVLPSGVEALGNWAFAHMHELKVLTVPGRDIVLGKQSFLDCPRLQKIEVAGDGSENPGTPYFLATTVTILNAPELFMPKEISDFLSHASYMEKYDDTLVRKIVEADDCGYEPFFLGWFNDEDADGVQKPRFIANRRKEKVALTLLRLRYDKHLSMEHRQFLYEYLQKRFEDTLWEMLAGEYGKEVAVMEILKNAGLLSSENRRKLVEYLSPGEAEVIAYLLRGEATEKMDFSAFAL